MFNFIEKAKSIYGDYYDYSETKYINSRTPFYIICPKHGLLKKDYNHFIIRKQGCPYCKNNITFNQDFSNYKKEYDELINKAKDRKYFINSERHHVIPRSMGGNNSPDNLVYLTPSEHYKAHYLLWKFTSSVKMAYAFWRMNMGKDILGETEYERLRVQISEENSKRNSKPVYCLELDKEFNSLREAGIELNIKNASDIGSVCNGKLKTAGKMHWCWLKDKEVFLKRKDEMLYETEHWQEIKNKRISESKKGKPNLKSVGRHLSEEAKKKISEANKGRVSAMRGKHLSKETRAKIREKVIGRTSPMKGKHLSEEAKKKLSLAKGIKIQCVETGIVYNSLKEAAEKINGYGFLIKDAILTNKEYKGYHWKLV